MQIELSGFNELTRNLGLASQEISRAFNDIRYAFVIEAQSIIDEVLIQTAAQEGPDSFPPHYVEPMVSAAHRIINVSGIDVLIDFELMGTWDDLTLGYHEGARLAGGGAVSLPWTGGTSEAGLKNDVVDRYQFWLAVLHGEKYNNIDTTGMWENTISARLDAWGELAPQWLLLEYGQEEWEPTIRSYPIVETITAELSGLFTSMLTEEIERIVEQVNLGQAPTGAVIDIRGRGSKFRDLSTGRFVKGE